MSAAISPTVPLPAPARAWRRSLAGLAGLWVLLFGLFWRDTADMAMIWWTSSSFNHCLFIPPIIAWLAWQRADALAGLTPRPWAWGLAIVLSSVLAWILGSAAGVAVLRHAALIVMAQGMVVALLGPVATRALLFPLAYALFLIPAGTEAEPFLQILTARMAMGLLGLSGVPAMMEGIFITTPNGYFRVAEACSGTAFLIAMNAYAALAANQCFRNPSRRVLFWAFALLTCLLANGVRAFGIIFIAYHSSVNSAVVVDHVVYGWVFFAAVIALVMLVGAPWFDRNPGDAWVEGPALRAREAALPAGGGGLRVIAAAALLPLLPLAWSLASDRGAQPLPERVPVPQLAGWSQIADPARSPWLPSFSNPDRVLIAHFREAGSGAVVDLALVQFTRQTEGQELVSHGQGAAALDGRGAWLWSAPLAGPPHARAEQLTGPGGRLRRAYTFYYVNGMLTGSATGVKLATLSARLLGGDQRAMAVMVSAEHAADREAGEASARAMARFLAALGPMDAFAARSLASD